MAKKYMQDLAQMMAKKAMSMGGSVEMDDDDEREGPVGLQERGEYDPEEMGGSEEMAKALLDQMSKMAYGGEVSALLAEHSPDVMPGEPATVPTKTPESLGQSDLTEEAKKALAEKKKRRASGMGKM